MKFLIKVCPDPEDHGKREELLRDCLKEFLTPAVKNSDVQGQPVISRDQKGKPYFQGDPWKQIEFSMSHSDGFWACVMGRCPLGIDIQKKRPCRYEDIAKKHFWEAEVSYVCQQGLDGFYEIWTRREALAKYTGLGFFGMFENRPSLVTEDGKLKEIVMWNQKYIRFEKLDMEDDFEGAWCREEEK